MAIKYRATRHRPDLSGRGYMLMFTIIALTVSFVILVPILTYVSTVHLTTVKTLERKESRLIRETGVEYGIAKLKYDRPLLSGLSTQPLTPAPMPLPPAETNGQVVTSLTATLLTPSQWDLVEAPHRSGEIYVSSLPPELPRPGVTTRATAPGARADRDLEPAAPVQPPGEGMITASAPVITVTKTASPTQVSPGGQVTYTISLTNTGDQTATTREIVDTLPSGANFSYILGSTTGGITANPRVTGGGRTLTWDSVPSIAAGGALTFSFRVLTGSVTGQFYNQVLADGQNFPDVSTGNTAPVFVGPRMRITKTSSPSVAPAGTNVTYTVVINNDTAGTNATLTTIQDTLALGFSYVSGSTTGAITANPQITGQVNLTWTGTWTVVGGGSFTFSFQATTTPNWGTFYNTVTIQGTNFPSVTTGPTAAVTTVGWIQITKAVDNSSPGGGEAVTYTITVNNVGPSTVSISKITDTIPTTFVYITGSTSGTVSGDPSITGNTLTWQGVQIPSGIAASAQFSFSFRTTVPDTSDDYTNEASIFVNWLGNNYTIDTGPAAAVSVITQARIVISEASGDTSGPPGWGNVNVKGYGFAPNKTLVLYWVDMNNPLDPRTAIPTGTNLLPGQTVITLSASYAPVSFNPVSITIPANANWGNGYVVALMEKSSSVWEEKDRKPFNVRAKYEIVSQTSDGVTLTARVAFTGLRSPDGVFSTPTNNPLITIYEWKE